MQNNLSLKGDFLPIQLICGTESIPHVQFLESFSWSLDEKHYSNETESIKLFDEIIIR